MTAAEIERLITPRSLRSGAAGVALLALAAGGAMWRYGSDGAAEPVSVDDAVVAEPAVERVAERVAERTEFEAETGFHEADARQAVQPEAATLGAVLGNVARDAGLGLAVSEALAERRVVLDMPDTLPWRARLAGAAALGGFEPVIQDGILLVAPGGGGGPGAGAASAGRIEPASSEVRREQGERREVIEIVALEHAHAADVADAAALPLSRLGVEIGVDPAANALVLSAPRQALAEAVEAVRALDVRRRRLLLETHIVELTETARAERGVRWLLEGDALGGLVDFPVVDPSSGAAEVTATAGGPVSLRARLSMLEADGLVRVVSRPRIVVLEGSAASIEAVRIVRVRFPDRGAVVSDSEVSVGSGRAFDEISVGVSLEVVPVLRGAESVVLQIAAEASTLGPPQPPDGIPEELSRRVEAEVSVQRGRTAVLGGLMREGRADAGAGVPLLRAIPLLGSLFGNRSIGRDLEELVVLVTPHVLE